MMQAGDHYHNIDLEKTGRKMKSMILSSGLTVQEIQEYLYLSCPQPIYRWFRGQILPSVDHLYMLSRLLGVHMEELIVPAGQASAQMPFALLDYEEHMYSWKTLDRMQSYCLMRWRAA